MPDNIFTQPRSVKAPPEPPFHVRFNSSSIIRMRLSDEEDALNPNGSQLWLTLDCVTDPRVTVRPYAIEMDVLSPYFRRFIAMIIKDDLTEKRTVSLEEVKQALLSQDLLVNVAIEYPNLVRVTRVLDCVQRRNS